MRRILGRDPQGRVIDIEVAGEEGVIGETAPQAALPDLPANASLPQVRTKVNAILVALRGAGVIDT